MTDEPVPSMGFARRLGIVGFAAIAVWAACGFWNSVKPLPAGLHATSLPARLTEAQVDFIDDSQQRGALLERELDMIDRAEQAVVVDEGPLTSRLFEHLLMRKRQRPNVRILLVTDARSEVYGGTAASTLSSLEQAGVVIARVRLDRMRDSNPLYSSLWRLGMGWWSTPFDETPGEVTLASTLRRLNNKADERQLIAADDGAGGWTSLVMSAAPLGNPLLDTDLGLLIRGNLARDIVASELGIAAWSSGDDRLPALPPVGAHGVGSIDARFLTEGAVATALHEVINLTVSGDSVCLMARALNDRTTLEALARAAARGVHLQLLLDPDVPGTQAAAAEMVHEGAGDIGIRWQAGASRREARYALVRHRSDIWIEMSSANLTRRDLSDFNLTAGVELHMPERSSQARAASDLFGKAWAGAAPYALHADASRDSYWRYRLEEATGMGTF
jgi:hypothetical protein